MGELKTRFQQERGIPVAAALEKVLLDSTQGLFNQASLPNQLDMYSKDVDNRRLVLQLQMLPDLVRTYNDMNPTTPITKLQILKLCVRS